MIKPFLYQVVSRIYAEYGVAIGEYTFVFPNRRAGLFFRKYLAEIADKPLFAPDILTINDLFMHLSGKQTADRIGMLFTLYNIYKRISAWDETFDEFVFWGEMLLNDFDDVDKYMVDAKMLFTNVTDLKEIESGFEHLSENQIAAIRSFWSTFNPRTESRNQQSFQSVWKILLPLYNEFKSTLAAENKGYEGMIFRDVVEKLNKGELDNSLPYRKLIFVGLNALSLAEEKLLVYFKNKGLADFYWDYASIHVNDPDNKASLFTKHNRATFPSLLTLPEENHTDRTPEIEIIGIPSAIGQAKQVYSILDQMQLTDDDMIRTAIVLPDENLLIPVLNAIPEKIKSINVTMGYPLGVTPIVSLVDSLASLQKNLRYVDARPMFYFRDVLPILNHRYVTSTDAKTATTIAQDIILHKKILVDSNILQQTPLLTSIFTPVENHALVSDYLLEILTQLTADGLEIEKEFIFHYHATISRMKDVIQETDVQMNIQTYFRLLKRLTSSISIPFRGEPLAGLQIMGILETRALDFNHLIILSMNEGIFPLRKSASSFIPYNLRKGFSLPTQERQDSVWAYHFYRLIHRANKLTLIYDSRANGLQTGEISRFIHQLNYHYNLPIRKKLVVYNVASSKQKTIEIHKNTDAIIHSLNRYRTNSGDRNISASAINTFLDCPLKFYFSSIKNISEEKELTETVESDEFGSIAHKALEDLYRPLCGRPLISADNIQNIRQNTTLFNSIINKAFAEIHLRSQTQPTLVGQDYLTAEMIRKYVDKILETDSKTLTPFQYIASEMRMNDTITLSDGSAVRLKGIIDRIDRTTDGAVRIVDYKSGNGKSDFTSIESLFDPENKDRPKAIMQVFMYTWMYGRTPNIPAAPLRPAIYYMRSLFSSKFDPYIYLKTARGAGEKIDSFAPIATPFEDALRQCLDKIFDPDTPFQQATTTQPCSYCTYKGICR
jgi:hypothetical protein